VFIKKLYFIFFTRHCGWLASPVTSISKKRDAFLLSWPVLHTHCLSFWPYFAGWLAQSLLLIKREMHLFSLCQFCTPIVSLSSPCAWLASPVTSTSRGRDAPLFSWPVLHIQCLSLWLLCLAGKYGHFYFRKRDASFFPWQVLHTHYLYHCLLWLVS